MSGHGIPSIYAGATHLDVDANAMLALARAKWHALSPTQQRALIGAVTLTSTLQLSYETSLPCAAALVRAGIARVCRRELTGLGIMVREAGIYTRENPD